MTGTAVVPEKDLQPYIDEALDEIEFIVGDSKTTKYGRLRSSLGRDSKPYKLKYVEMCVLSSFFAGFKALNFIRGNEDMVRETLNVAVLTLNAANSFSQHRGSFYTCAGIN